MKSSNPQVMVQAYRLLVKTMFDEFGECYPLHLGVTEAGDGEDGRIKSAIGIGTLMEDGLGDTIRVSLTEDPELEIPVCKDIVKRYGSRNPIAIGSVPAMEIGTLFRYKRTGTEFRYPLRYRTIHFITSDVKHLPLTISAANIYLLLSLT